MFYWPKSTESVVADSHRMRILLAIPSLGGGGAERVITTLARRFSRDRFDIHLMVAKNTGPLRNDLLEDITLHSLDRDSISQAAWPFLKLVRKLRPRVVLTAATHLNVLAGAVKTLFPRETRLIIRETSVLARSLATLSKTAQIFEPLFASAYRRADCVITQSSFALDEVRERFSVSPDKLIRIANPVDLDHMGQPHQNDSTSPFPAGPGPRLLAVGRLSPVKGFDRAIQALPALLQSHPGAQLWIIGEGHERSSLRQLAEDLGVSGNVFMPGFQHDVSRWMSHADLFVLTSRSESLPNVLLEAVGSGCPVIATHHTGGTQEVLDSLGLSNRWVTSLAPWSPEWFTPLSKSVRERLVQLYHWKQIVREYEQLLLRVTSGEQRSKVAA